jgi:carbon-monoxide dehydrogenase medium subunit
MDYVRAGSVKDALLALAADDGTKVLAGGHSLIPMMKFRLAAPPRVVDISYLEELRGVQEYKKGVRIGATTTYRGLMESDLLRERFPLIPEVAAGIGDVQVRNRGTIGGSLAHADPASDMPALMLALDATFSLRSKRGGRRTVSAREFFKGAFSTDMTSEELFTDILLPGMARHSGASYQSFDQAASGYAIVGACAVVTRSRRTIKHCVLAFTGIGDSAFLSKAADRLVDTKGEPADLASASHEAASSLDIIGDIHAPAEYRRHLAAVAARRAIAEAYERAGE